MLYDKLPGGKVKCNVCAVRCIIPEGDRGACRTRLNEKGTLYTLLYGRTSSVCIDPVEKKPLYHFYPGSRIHEAIARATSSPSLIVGVTFVTHSTCIPYRCRASLVISSTGSMRARRVTFL